MKPITRKVEIHTFYSGSKKDEAALCVLLAEIQATLAHRADGVKIEIERTNEFPPLTPIHKPLICKVKIETWDIAA